MSVGAVVMRARPVVYRGVLRSSRRSSEPAADLRSVSSLAAMCRLLMNILQAAQCWVGLGTVPHSQLVSLASLHRGWVHGVMLCRFGFGVRVWRGGAGAVLGRTRTPDVVRTSCSRLRFGGGALCSCLLAFWGGDFAYVVGSGR